MAAEVGEGGIKEEAESYPALFFFQKRKDMAQRIERDGRE